ncbi:MAG: TonB-dependent receptor [Sphingomonadales bacterium]|nr:TonB-dependent receptor [Sphingomonadales bacterium]
MQRIDSARVVARLLAGVCAVAMATPVLAQQKAAAAAGGDGQLDEIVVTAQKREQNLQVVPIAVSAITVEKIAKLGIADARDLSGLAPNVTVAAGTTSNSAAVISIRGISGGGSETFGFDSANAVYVDGVYIGRSAAAGSQVSDIERVEVLRGPQGTLFGRNTTGGAISFVSRKPSKTLRVAAEAGYGNYGAWNGKISIDPGEIAGISTSFSYTHGGRHGIVDNLYQADNAKDPGSFKSDAFRFAARAEIGGTGSIQYIFDYSKTTGSPMNFQLTNVANGTANPPVSVGGQLATVTQQAPVQQYLAGVTFANPACAALATPTRVWQQTVCNDVLGYSMDKSWGHNLQFENDFGAFKLKSITGYRQWANDVNSDLDGLGAFSGPQYSQATTFNGMPASLLAFIPTIPAAARSFIAGSAVPSVSQNLFTTSNQRRQRQVSEELEISGNAKLFDWVVGGFYFWEKGSENNPQGSGFVLDTNAAVFNSTNFGPLGAMFAAANPARYRLVQTLSTLAYSATSQSEAIYGQATVYPAGRDSSLRLTLGARYTWDQKSMMRTQNGAAALATPDSGKANFSRFTWNAMLGYDFAQGVTGYARVATGYRAGGFNSGDAVIVGTSTMPSFNAENITSYELGLKTELLDRHLRLNVAGYHNIYKNLQVAVPVSTAVPGNFTTTVQNAGRVHYTGFEADMQAVLNQYASIDGSVGYVDIKYKQFNSGLSTTGTVVDISSIAVPGYTSPLTANVSLDLHAPVAGGAARVYGRIGYTYMDGQYSFSSFLSSPFNPVLKGDNRKLVDLQVGVDRIRFGTAEGEIKFWVKNLTNEHALVRGIDFGQLGYAGGFYELPRTYGVKVGVKF